MGIADVANSFASRSNSLLKKASDPVIAGAARDFSSPKANKREIPFHIIIRNDEPTEFFNKLLKALGLPQDGLHAFRRGCNHRWELSGMNPAVLRQQMGHTSAAMTTRYTGEIPLDQVRAGFSTKCGNKIDVMEKTENLENEAARMSF